MFTEVESATMAAVVARSSARAASLRGLAARWRRLARYDNPHTARALAGLAQDFELEAATLDARA